MKYSLVTRLAGAVIAGAAIVGLPAGAAACQSEGSFGAWLEGVKREAAAMGLSQRAIKSGLANVRFDPGIVKKDRAQGVFAQDFLTFSNRMVASYRLQHGAKNLSKYKNTFARIEREFGVPAPVLTAFWGLETDFGANIGDGPTMTSLATLAYDCRRPDLFRHQLLSALRIIDRGDLKASELRGPWAGELGQVQFLPSHYVEYGVDYDGDRRVDMLKSKADSLASAANYLQALGWRRNQPWLREVRVSKSVPWDQADIAIKLPVTQWSSWGVKLANGRAIPANDPPASLLLPMGKDGPAFLSYHKFDVYLVWNKSLVYSTTAAYFATRLAGQPRVGKGLGATVLSLGEVKELQRLLKARGYDVGKVDGIIGRMTRAAVKDAQTRLGLPADSYPSKQLLSALRSG
ncbi:MAG: lytic murein transglycosylase [Alphaproteobacteria bacterium]